MATSLFCSCYHFFVRSCRLSKFDVILYRISKKIDFLKYFTNICEQAVQCVIPHIHSTDCNFSSINIPKPGNQITKRTLSGTRRADNGCRLLFRYGQTDMIQDFVFSVGEGNIIKNNIEIFWFSRLSMLIHDRRFINFFHLINRHIQQTQKCRSISR